MPRETPAEELAEHSSCLGRGLAVHAWSSTEGALDRQRGRDDVPGEILVEDLAEHCSWCWAAVERTLEEVSAEELAENGSWCWAAVEWKAEDAAPPVRDWVVALLAAGSLSCSRICCKRCQRTAAVRDWPSDRHAARNASKKSFMSS